MRGTISKLYLQMVIGFELAIINDALETGILVFILLSYARVV